MKKTINLEKMKKLRQHGYSLSEIAQNFHIAKSTVFRYVGAIPALPEYRELLKQKRGGSKKKKFLKEENALKNAQENIKILSFKEKTLFLAALYWAEGTKKDFCFSNTDPALIQVFVNGIREIFQLSDDRFRISIKISGDLNSEKCLQFWSKTINIPIEKFVHIDIPPGKKKGKLSYGVCRIRVTRGEELLKKFKAITAVVHSHIVPIA